MNPLCLRLAFLLGAALATTGCVSAKYQLMPKDAAVAAPPAVNLPATPTADLAATVNAVIVFHGPGSWKREAYWDEYVLTLTNPGSAAVTLESATLIDYQGQPVLAGENPWLIDKASKTWWQNVRTSEAGRLLKLGGVTFLTGAATVGVAFASGGIMGPVSAGSLAAANALALVTVAIPIYAVGSVIRNVSSRHDVEAEFNRRRLALPTALEPGAGAAGSLFFRITPGPRRLMLRYRVGADTREATIELAPLAGLHFKDSPAPR